MKNLKTMLMGTIKVMTLGLFIFGYQGIFAWKTTKEEFLNALKNGNFNKVKDLIKQDKTLVNTQNRQYVKGRTALHEAAWNGHLEIVKELIANGANINAQNKYGETALHEAAWNGDLKIVKYLIEKGANINATDNYGSTPLHKAAWKGHLEIVKYLIENGANKDAKNKDGKTAYDPPPIFITFK